MPYEDLIKIFKERNPEADMYFINAMAETFSAVDPETTKYWVENNFEEYFDGYSTQKLLENMQIPLLVVQANFKWGMIDDKHVEWAKTLMSTLSHVYLEELPHWLGIRDGRENILLDAINPFLESLK